jgi:hypothetical protein
MLHRVDGQKTWHAHRERPQPEGHLGKGAALSSSGNTRTSPPSVARALDDARGLIAGAWDRDERPEYLLCSPALYALVAESKKRESESGRALRLLGLLVVSSPDLDNQAIAVR